MLIERKLAAIMFTDIVGFTKIMTTSEDTAINILQVQDGIFNPLLKEHSGNLLKKMGDGLLVEFSSAVNAVECALKIQASIKNHNEAAADEFHIRIGIHLGDVLMLGDDILGDGVNIASRIEPLASPDGICITEAVNQSIKSKLKIDARRISEVDLKHIDDKYTIYKLPKNDDSDIDKERSVKGNNPKIKILEIKDITKTSEEVFKTFYQSCIFGIITFLSFIPMFILGMVVGISLKKGFKVSVNDFTPILPNNMQILIYILSLVVFIMFLTFALRKKEYKILFKDIRNVDSILNHMITENPSFAIKYEIVEQKGNTISYYPYGSKLSLLKTYEDAFNRKMVKILPFMKDFETLQLSFDGNVVIARGMAGGIDKLKKRLKILELI
ncbi:MAG: adenylate/guanylate cyclase domain-containing protein [Candidatus Marinimicrobia bacterium]|nr:adenylate/guanylate cyclase domain-containing protein [Candidatus Neomarinimicrobiota bacterium]